MDDCRNCEFRGYSPQLCAFHHSRCAGSTRKPVPPSIELAATTAAGAGLGVALVVLGSAAVALVTGPVAVHALLVKLCVGAGAAGGGFGLAKGLKKLKQPK